MNKKPNVIQKGAARKWSQRLKELGQQPPPQDLVDILNKKDEKKKSASPSVPSKNKDVEV